MNLDRKVKIIKAIAWFFAALLTFPLKSLPLFKIGGSRLILHNSMVLYILVLPIISGFSSLETVGLIFFSVVLHEFGHIFAARRCGQQTGDIYLLPIGGMAQVKIDSDDWRHEFYIALTGPTVSLILACLFGFVSCYVSSDALETLYYGNFMLFLFNICLPIFPMDGGRLLRSALCWVTRGDIQKATREALWIGLICAAGLTVGAYLAGLWSIVVVMAIVLFLGKLEYDGLKKGKTEDEEKMRLYRISVLGLCAAWEVYKREEEQPKLPEDLSSLITSIKRRVETGEYYKKTHPSILEFCEKYSSWSNWEGPQILNYAVVSALYAMADAKLINNKFEEKVLEQNREILRGLLKDVNIPLAV